MRGERNAAYAPVVADYFDRAPLAGVPEGDLDSVFTGIAGCREQGTEVVFHARIRAALITEIRYQVFGCPHTIAACALIAESLTNQPAQALVETAVEPLLAALALPVEKKGRMFLILDALRKCFLAWDNRRLD